MQWNTNILYSSSVAGLAHLGLNNTSAALECQKYFLAIAHMTNHLAGKFRALGNYKQNSWNAIWQKNL